MTRSGTTTVRLIEAPQTYQLRHKVLRPNSSLQDCQWPKDFEKETFHIGAFVDSQEMPVTVATFYPEVPPNIASEIDQPSYRLRGMATDPQYLRQGWASKVMSLGLEEIDRRGGHSLWFNARKHAFGFYESLGFRYYGELFEIEGIGPHKVMAANLGDLKS